MREISGADAVARFKKAKVHGIATVEDDRRRPGKLTAVDTVGEIARGKIRGGDAAVAHHPQPLADATGRRGIGAGHAADHVAVFQQCQRVSLVIQRHLHQQSLAQRDIGDRVEKPARQRVGIDRDRQCHPAVAGLFGQFTFQFPFQHADLAHMAQQPVPGGGGPHRGAAHQQHLAEALFQLADALRHRRRRNAQHARRLLETAFRQHGLQRVQQFVIQHPEFF